MSSSSAQKWPLWKPSLLGCKGAMSSHGISCYPRARDVRLGAAKRQARGRGPARRRACAIAHPVLSPGLAAFFTATRKPSDRFAPDVLSVSTGGAEVVICRVCMSFTNS